jgi:hypothetical protein
VPDLQSAGSVLSFGGLLGANGEQSGLKIAARSN